MTLEQAIKAACEKMQVDGIEGWGLVPPEGLDGELVQVSGPTGCDNEQCNHVSHDEQAPTYRWVPTQGTLVKLARERDGEGAEVVYYVLRSEAEDVGLVLRAPRHYHAGVEVVPVEDLPAYVLASLAA